MFVWIEQFWCQYKELQTQYTPVYSGKNETNLFIDTTKAID